MPVGFKIKKLREEKDLSQSRLAAELNISQSELSKIENGKAKKIDFYLMIKICSVFNKSFEYFLNKKTVKTDNFNINRSIEIIFNEFQKIIEDSKQKDRIIKSLKND